MVSEGKTLFFSADKITCSNCVNVELFYTQLNSGVGIRTTLGNKAITRKVIEERLTSIIPKDEYVYGIFESHQDEHTYFIVYTENAEEGKLYNFNIFQVVLEELITGLTPTQKACETDFTQGWSIVYIF